MKRILIFMAIVLIVSSVTWMAAQTAPTAPPDPQPPYKRLTGPQTKNPGVWNYPDAYDAVAAAPDIHHVRYEDDHVRLVEVAYFPGLHGNMHGHPWPSVFAYDSTFPKIKNVTLEGGQEGNLITGMRAKAPVGSEYPTCAAAAPQTPHAVTNEDTFPLHFFRLEFKRIDGDDIKTKWKTMYPRMLQPLKHVTDINPRDPKLGPPVSKEYPFAAATESYKAAPNNHIVRYEDDHVVFLEVTIRATERENIHGHENNSVFMMDAPFPRFEQGGKQPEHNNPGLGKADVGGDWRLDPTAREPMGGAGTPPPGTMYPRCSTSAPQLPHAFSNSGDFPMHFYRLQYKRIDGDGIKDHWRQWYPWMAKLSDDRKAHPKAVNY